MESSLPPRQSSLFKRLTILLLIIVFLFGSLSLLFFSIINRFQDQREFDAKVEVFITSLSQSLALALWDLDEPKIISISEVYTKNDLIGSIEVIRTDGFSYFKWRNPDVKISRFESTTVSFNNENVGVITMGFTTNLYDNLYQRYNWYYIITMLIMFFVWAVAILWVIRKISGIPLSSLNQQVAAYREGVYDLEVTPVPYLEFMEFQQILTTMGSSIKSHIDALLQSEEKFKTLVTNIEEVVYMISSDGIFQLSEGMGLKKIGLKPGQVVGQSVFELYKEYPEIVNAVRIVLGGTAITTEVRLGANYLRIWHTPKYDKTGQIIGLFGLAINITEQKQAEEKIKAALKEKETLLHEIHHRVKNNMQIIASLLRLQLVKSDKKDVNAILKENIGRVYAMAMIHESLHQSESLSTIDFGAYLSELGQLLLQTFTSNQGGIMLDIKASGIHLSIEKANPLGLVINELVSNSLKYAFQPGVEGTISITAETINENDLEIVIADDGIGMPESFDWNQTESLGLHLVKNIVERQLDGSIEYLKSEGCAFRIRLSLESNYVQLID